MTCRVPFQFLLLNGKRLRLPSNTDSWRSINRKYQSEDRLFVIYFKYWARFEICVRSDVSLMEFHYQSVCSFNTWTHFRWNSSHKFKKQWERAKDANCRGHIFLHVLQIHLNFVISFFMPANEADFWKQMKFRTNFMCLRRENYVKFWGCQQNSYHSLAMHVFRIVDILKIFFVELIYAPSLFRCIIRSLIRNSIHMCFIKLVVEMGKSNGPINGHFSPVFDSHVSSNTFAM